MPLPKRISGEKAKRFPARMTRAERAVLVPSFGTEAELAKAQKFAHQRAVKENDRATYQAMEALIHNLNTMHSRPGAPTPLSSINYGMDTSP